MSLLHKLASIAARQLMNRTRRKKYWPWSSPDPALWKYYIIRAILTGPGVVFALPYLYFRYHTLRYRFDGEGIHMKVGILFRREINSYVCAHSGHSSAFRNYPALAWPWQTCRFKPPRAQAVRNSVIEGFKEFGIFSTFFFFICVCERYRRFWLLHRMGRQDSSDSAARPAAVRESRRLVLAAHGYP